MIKKFLIGLFSLLFIMPAMANVQLSSDAIRSVVTKHVVADKQNDVVEDILARIKANKGAGVTPYDLAWSCVKAGWNMETEEGVNTCTKFVTELLDASTVDFYDACDSGAVPSGGTKKCYEDYQKIQVDNRSAYFLAGKLIAKKNANEGKVFCAKEERHWFKHRNGLAEIDDYVPCTSLSNNVFYTVRFDDAKEKKDETRRNGVAKAVCEVLNGVTFTPAGNTPGSQFAQPIFWNASCSTSDAAKCNKISSELNEFGFSSSIVNNTCEVSFETMKEQDLKHPFGLDSFAFCRNIQVSANASLDALVEEYVRKNANVSVTSFSCAQSDVSYIPSGRDKKCTTKVGNIRDDVLRCYVNGQEVDFVFDDLSEARRVISLGGYQGLSCIASDGSFDGKRCMGLNEAGCNLVIEQNASTCPECRDVRWDPEKNLCVLPSSSRATNLQKGLEVAGVIVMAGGAAAVTALSGGTLSGVWVIVANVGTGLTIGGATAVVASKAVTTFLVYTEGFRSELNRCLTSDDVQCAKDMLQKYLQKMVNYEKDLTDAEKKTLDESFAKLFKKIPAEDEFWSWLDDPKVWQCNSRGDCVVKEKTQFWQGVRTIGDISMIIGGVLKSFAVIASSMTKTTEVAMEVAQTRKARITANPLKNVKSNLVRDVTYGNTNSLSIPNSFIKQGVTINGKTLTFARNSDLAKYLVSQGYKVGDTVEIALEGIRQTVLVPTTTMSFANVVFNPAALASTVYGTGDLLVDGEMIPFVMRRPSGEADGSSAGIPEVPVLPDVEIQDEEIEIPDFDPIEENDPVIVPIIVPTQGGATTSKPADSSTTDKPTSPTKTNGGQNSTTSDKPTVPTKTNGGQNSSTTDKPIVSTTTSGDRESSSTTTDKPIVSTTTSGSRESTTTSSKSSGSATMIANRGVSSTMPAETTTKASGTKSKNGQKSGISGLGAAAIGAGVAGLGVGAALLIGGAGSKGDKVSGTATTVTSGNADLFNSIKSRANGIIGYVNDSSIELVPIETANGTKDNVVSIEGHAVVVAKHNGNLIPFMVDTENGSTKWVPFTNVNVNTHAFDKYAPKTDIMRTAQIADKLAESLSPLQMQYFASPNADGVQFASPSMNGYTTINNNSLRYLSFNFNKNTRLGVFLFG